MNQLIKILFLSCLIFLILLFLFRRDQKFLVHKMAPALSLFFTSVNSCPILVRIYKTFKIDIL